jgi:hypothetical protein
VTHTDTFKGPFSNGTAGIYYNTPVDGATVSYRIEAVDNLGNTNWYPSSTTWNTFIYDGSAPTTSLNIGISNHNYNITSVTPLTLSCNDATGSGCNKTYYRIGSGTFTEYSSPITISGSDGSYILQYYSKDNANNTETTKEKTLTLDNTPPSTTDNSNSTWTNADVTVTLTPSDGTGSGVNLTKYCVDTAGTCTPATEGTSVSVTCATDSICQKYVRYFSSDNLGNNETVKSSNLIKIDKQKPVTALTIGEPKYEDSGKIYVADGAEVNLTCNDGTGSGCNETYYKVEYQNGTVIEDWTIYTHSLIIPDAAHASDGNYTIYYYSTDNSGNNETANSTIVIIDNTPPATSDNAPSGWQSADVIVTLTPNDGTGSGVAHTYYCVDTAGTCTPSTSGTSVSVTCSVGSVCQQYVRYFSTDNLANAETVKTSNLIKIDKQNPVSSITSPSQNSIFASDFPVSVSDTDNLGSGLNTGLCQYKVLSNGVMTRDWIARACNSDVTLSVGVAGDCRNDQGTCTIQVRATDNVGNVATVTERTFSIDWTKAPQILNSGPSGTITNSFTSLYVQTNKPATCKYDSVFKSNYDAMNYTMATTGNLNHYQPLEDLTDKTYNYYVICKDTANNNMSNPAQISFDVDTRENFVVTVPETKGDYLRTGWNQFFLPSFVLNDTNLTSPYYVEDVLLSVTGNYSSLYHFNGTAWTSYVPGRPVNDLLVFNGGGFPYFINMATDGKRIEI